MVLVSVPPDDVIVNVEVDVDSVVEDGVALVVRGVLVRVGSPINKMVNMMLVVFDKWWSYWMKMMAGFDDNIPTEVVFDVDMAGLAPSSAILEQCLSRQQRLNNPSETESGCFSHNASH